MARAGARAYRESEGCNPSRVQGQSLRALVRALPAEAEDVLKIKFH